MDLREYLFYSRMSVAKFSKLINYNPNYVSGVLNGRLNPGLKFIRAVKAATKGQVIMRYHPPDKEKDEVTPAQITPSDE